ncbi:hypothetical protein [Actinomadura sp. HBU206391]|uniref:hypothetical protein n=1 Tax=Actinomadura sp. HBU206391 TaxID=2731692 RepID=UPI0016504C3F|nr:hypothetical protein [Actinomadura sp. HBU206391]MBC6457448.1 hypothetical protein [Actinomadura sp. HBU206391]
MSKIKYTRSLALAAVSAALAGGVVSLSVSANAELAPQGAMATRVATDGPPDPIPNVRANSASSRKAGGDRADGRSVPLGADDAEDSRVIGNDPLGQRALKASAQPEPAPTPRPAPASPSGQQPAAQNPASAPAASSQPATSAQQAPSGEVAPSAGQAAPSAQQAPSGVPSGRRIAREMPRDQGDDDEAAQSAQKAPAQSAQKAPAQSAQKAPGLNAQKAAAQNGSRQRAAQAPGVSRRHANAQRGHARRGQQAQSRKHAAQRGAARRPGAAAVPQAEKHWRDLLSESPANSASMWNEP